MQMSREQKRESFTGVVCFVTEERVEQQRTMGKTAFTLRVSVFVGARGLCLWPKIFLNHPVASLSADLDTPRHAHCLSFPSSRSCNMSSFRDLYSYQGNSHTDHPKNTRYDTIPSLTEIVFTSPLLRRPTHVWHVKVVFAEVPASLRPSLNSKL